MLDTVKNLLKVKSLVTLAMTAALIVLLLSPEINPTKELLALYCTSYGSIITYFFTHKSDVPESEAENDENIAEGN